ncbi:MAG TPA: CrcB family protein [Mycobacteriales bacterium]|nr:CrcB family protein [Mycobacteriales bacterium]
MAVVGAGGLAGGLARYGVGLAWSTTPGAFPWATFLVNTTGTFVLALLLVLVLEVLPPTPYLRAAVGTGFCGAFTTFSSVVTETDRLAAHGHVGLAAGYVMASLGAGLVAAMIGLGAGRAFAEARQMGRG